MKVSLIRPVSKRLRDIPFGTAVTIDDGDLTYVKLKWPSTTSASYTPEAAKEPVEALVNLGLTLLLCTLDCSTRIAPDVAMATVIGEATELMVMPPMVKPEDK